MAKHGVVVVAKNDAVAMPDRHSVLPIPPTASNGGCPLDVSKGSHSGAGLLSFNVMWWRRLTHGGVDAALVHAIRLSNGHAECAPCGEVVG